MTARLFHVKPIGRYLGRSCPSTVDSRKAVAICTCQFAGVDPASASVLSRVGGAGSSGTLGAIVDWAGEVFLFGDMGIFSELGIPGSVPDEHETGNVPYRPDRAGYGRILSFPRRSSSWRAAC